MSDNRQGKGTLGTDRGATSGGSDVAKETLAQIRSFEELRRKLMEAQAAYYTLAASQLQAAQASATHRKEISNLEATFDELKAKAQGVVVAFKQGIETEGNWNTLVIASVTAVRALNVAQTALNTGGQVLSNAYSGLIKIYADYLDLTHGLYNETLQVYNAEINVIAATNSYAQAIAINNLVLSEYSSNSAQANAAAQALGYAHLFLTKATMDAQVAQWQLSNASLGLVGDMLQSGAAILGLVGLLASLFGGAGLAGKAMNALGSSFSNIVTDLGGTSDEAGQVTTTLGKVTDSFTGLFSSVDNGQGGLFGMLTLLEKGLTTIGNDLSSLSADFAKGLGLDIGNLPKLTVDTSNLPKLTVDTSNLPQLGVDVSNLPKAIDVSIPSLPSSIGIDTTNLTADVTALGQTPNWVTALESDATNLALRPSWITSLDTDVGALANFKWPSLPSGSSGITFSFPATDISNADVSLKSLAGDAASAQSALDNLKTVGGGDLSSLSADIGGVDWNSFKQDASEAVGAAEKTFGDFKVSLTQILDLRSINIQFPDLGALDLATQLASLKNGLAGGLDAIFNFAWLIPVAVQGIGDVISSIQTGAAQGGILTAEDFVAGFIMHLGDDLSKLQNAANQVLSAIHIPQLTMPSIIADPIKGAFGDIYNWAKSTFDQIHGLTTSSQTDFSDYTDSVTRDLGKLSAINITMNTTDAQGQLTTLSDYTDSLARKLGSPTTMTINTTDAQTQLSNLIGLWNTATAAANSYQDAAQRNSGKSTSSTTGTTTATSATTGGTTTTTTTVTTPPPIVSTTGSPGGTPTTKYFYQGGGIAPETAMALVHAREMVLPPAISDMFVGLANTYKNATTASPTIRLTLPPVPTPVVNTVTNPVVSPTPVEVAAPTVNIPAPIVNVVTNPVVNPTPVNVTASPSSPSPVEIVTSVASPSPPIAIETPTQELAAKIGTIAPALTDVLTPVADHLTQLARVTYAAPTQAPVSPVTSSGVEALLGEIAANTKTQTGLSNPVTVQFNVSVSKEVDYNTLQTLVEEKLTELFNQAFKQGGKYG